MLFLVICNNQHLVRTPVRVLILNDKTEKKEANILFKIIAFLNQSTYSFKFKAQHFLLQYVFPSCPLKSFSTVFTYVTKTFLFTGQSLEKKLIKALNFPILKCSGLHIKLQRNAMENSECNRWTNLLRSFSNVSQAVCRHIHVVPLAVRVRQKDHFIKSSKPTWATQGQCVSGECRNMLSFISYL